MTIPKSLLPLLFYFEFGCVRCSRRGRWFGYPRDGRSGGERRRAQKNVFQPVGIIRHQIIRKRQEAHGLTIGAHGWPKTRTVRRRWTGALRNTGDRQTRGASRNDREAGVTRKDVLDAVRGVRKIRSK